MTNCMKCSNEVAEGSMFCNHCGASMNTAPRSDSNSDTKKKLQKASSKFSRSKMIIAAVSLIILLGAGFFIYSYLTNDVNKVKSLTKQGKITEAVATYKNDIIDKAKEVKEIEAYITVEIASIEEDFINNNIEYSEAKSKLNDLSKFELLEKDIKGVQTKIRQLNLFSPLENLDTKSVYALHY